MCCSVYPGVGWQSQCDGGQSGGTLDGEVSYGAISQQQPLGLEMPNTINNSQCIDIFKSEWPSVQIQFMILVKRNRIKPFEATAGYASHNDIS